MAVDEEALKREGWVKIERSRLEILQSAIEHRVRDAALEWLENYTGLEPEGPLFAAAIEDYLTDENFITMFGHPTGLSAEALAFVRDMAIEEYC